MTDNDFYIAIQGILEQAVAAGWNPYDVEMAAFGAIEEWIDEYYSEKEDE